MSEEPDRLPQCQCTYQSSCKRQAYLWLPPAPGKLVPVCHGRQVQAPGQQAWQVACPRWSPHTCIEHTASEVSVVLTRLSHCGTCMGQHGLAQRHPFLTPKRMKGPAGEPIPQPDSDICFFWALPTTTPTQPQGPALIVTQHCVLQGLGLA